MKKFLFVCTVFSFLVFSHSVSGQIRNAIVLGASASQIDGDGVGGFDKAGLIFGGSSNFKISENFSLQPEILWLQKGSKTSNRDSLQFFRWRLNYVSMPVLIYYRIQPKFSLQGGLAFDYLIDAKQDDGFGFIDRTQDLNKFDLNYTGGIEYRIWDNLAANARFQYSFFWLRDLGFKNSNVLVTLRFYLGNNQ